jgi:very-short-patch-repair endonuclease
LFEDGLGFSPLGETGEGFEFCITIYISMPIKNIVTNQKVTKEKLERAKELRREMTPAEKRLWQEVRAKKLSVRFRRQQVIAGFIVDFYCHKAALVVEVDGDIHELQQHEDARREKVLTDIGLRMIRFQNDEIFTDLFAVVQSIRNSISVENHLKIYKAL